MIDTVNYERHTTKITTKSPDGFTIILSSIRYTKRVITIKSPENLPEKMEELCLL